MMDQQHAAAQRLVDLALPYLSRQDPVGLAEALEGHWSPACLALLLDHPEARVVRVAAECLGVCGEMADGPAVARILHHADESVVRAAEDALWSIWLRAGGWAAQRALVRIAESIRRGETENVVPMLTELIRARPAYAEAFHQRAQAHYLLEDAAAAARDARRALQLNPLHFGALSIQAHVFADTGRYPEAVHAYRAVLRIHPKMPGVREALAQFRKHAAATAAPKLSIVHADS